jgi:hypothetical protein
LLTGGVVVFPVGKAVGVAFTSVFFSSFFSPFAGLAAGEAFVEGLETVTGEVAEGDAAGVFVLGALFSGVGVHAPAKAAKAARTVSRISLLIVFSFRITKFGGLSGRPRSSSLPPPSYLHSRMQPAADPPSKRAAVT